MSVFTVFFCFFSLCGKGGVVEALMSGDEEELWTFSVQTMIAILEAFVAWVMMDTLCQMRLSNAAAPTTTVERGTQSELNLVDQVKIPTNVYCSPGGVCYHTSRDCEGLKNVPMNAIGRRRLCMYCVQRKGE